MPAYRAQVFFSVQARPKYVKLIKTILTRCLPERVCDPSLFVRGLLGSANMGLCRGSPLLPPGQSICICSKVSAFQNRLTHMPSTPIVLVLGA